ncbi:rho guanine nucleotide exchange factor 11-like isoform X2 [Corvus hawaiiensis]|uniref:rho guanine nucleotide exchange factor 11-like isoform X2 n=1 Tax=Corvus hawaiiensis TaxID=134902 RepID=UPI002018F64D|nr:rho guanine nucleotide exchange factor 11-like isoform X2 [Corvus hawaiiensis]
MKKLREEGTNHPGNRDLMLARFDGAAKEEFQRVAATFCSYQSIALELIKTKQRKESRFQLFMQEAESNPQCRRLQLKDLIVSEMQRLTKYPLLLENIIKCTEAGSAEQEKLCRARDQCRDVLRFVNDAVRRAENRHRLQGYQRRLDTAGLERTSNPLAAEFRNLDLTSHRMIHEGPLTWRVAKDKTVELHVLLLEDLLVLLQRQDERLVLKCHSKSALGASSDTKGSFSPVLKLNSVLIRSVATDKRALFIICTSELGPQIYELVALTSSEKNTWMELLEQAVQGATRSVTGPPKRHHGEATTAAAGLELPDPDVSPVLSRGSGAEPEAEDCSSADSDPDPSGRDKPLEELLEEPGGHEGDLGQAGIGVADPIPGVPKSLGGAGVAEAALQDVETLQLLIVRWLRPGRDPDPEDDVTPHALGGRSSLRPGLGFRGVRPGLGDVQLGFSDVRPGFAAVQPGFTGVQSRSGDVRPGFAHVRPGFAHVQSGFGDVRPGFADVRPGFSCPGGILGRAGGAGAQRDPNRPESPGGGAGGGHAPARLQPIRARAAGRRRSQRRGPWKPLTGSCCARWAGAMPPLAPAGPRRPPAPPGARPRGDTPALPPTAQAPKPPPTFSPGWGMGWAGIPPPPPPPQSREIFQGIPAGNDPLDKPEAGQMHFVGNSPFSTPKTKKQIL